MYGQGGRECSIRGVTLPRPAQAGLLCTLAALLSACALGLAARRGRTTALDLPPIVFVSRQPPSGADAGQIPGLGPHGSTIAVGGRLLLLERDGSVRTLLAPGALYDVQDPDVSWDAKRVVFSGLVSADARWRLFVLTLASGEIEPLPTRAGAGADEFDPCWNGERVLFVRAEHGQSLYDSSRAGALYEWRADRDTAVALLREANGLLDPVVDAQHHAVVFARWWFNPWLPLAEGGVTREGSQAMTRDSVNQWQVLEYAPRFGERLRAGGVLDRRAGMGVQPALVGDAVVATFTRNSGLAPRPGPSGVHLLPRVGMPGRRIAGAAIGDDLANPYSEGTGLSAPSACAPAALPDGRLIVSFAAGARDDFGLWLVTLAGRRTMLVDQPGVLELDAAPVVKRPGPPVELGITDSASRGATTFRFVDRDVFAGAGAPQRQRGARLRFLALSPGASTPTPIAEIAIPRSGRVDVRVPHIGPTFEQLIGSGGRVLMTAHGPAQVRGFNSPPAGGEARCVGCHLGHSALR